MLANNGNSRMAVIVPMRAKKSPMPESSDSSKGLDSSKGPDNVGSSLPLRSPSFGVYQRLSMVLGSAKVSKRVQLHVGFERISRGKMWSKRFLATWDLPG